MIFCQNNLITTTNTTVTGGNSNFPIDNLVSGQLSNYTEFDAAIVIDLGTATLIDTLAIVDADTSITIEANTSDSWGPPAFTQSMTLVSGTDISLKFISETYRFWRISAPSQTFIAHAYIGNRLVFPDPLYGSAQKRNNTDIQNTSQAGQRYNTPGVVVKDQTLEIRFATDAQNAILNTFNTADYRSDSGIFAQTETDFDNFKPYFAVVDLQERSHSRPGRWSYTLNVEEAR